MKLIKLKLYFALFLVLTIILNGQPRHPNFILIENFENNEQKWFTGQSSQYNYSIEQNVYKIRIMDTLTWNITRSFNELSLDNFFFEIEIKAYQGERLGILFAGKDNQNAFLFCWNAKKNLSLINVQNGAEKTIQKLIWPNNLKQIKTIYLLVKEKKFTLKVNNIPILVNFSITPIGKSFGFSVKNGFLEIQKIATGNLTNEIDLVENWEGFNTPVKLGDEINSPYIELVPVVSPNGMELYFTRRNDPENFGNEGKDDIFYTYKLDNGQWAKSKRLPPPLNNNDANYVCSIANKGTMLLLGNRYKPDGTCEGGVSISRKIDTSWTFPEDLKITNFYNDSKNQEFFLSSDSKVLIMAVQRKDSRGLKDLYVSFRENDGSWSEPKNMGNVINTPANELSPFLSPDNKKLFFSSYGHPGFGNADIFVSERLDDSYLNWTKPKNLGPKINSQGFDAYFSITQDYSKAYLVKTSSTSKQDIYEVSLDSSLINKSKIKVYGNLTSSIDQTGICLTFKIRQSDTTYTIESKENGYYEFWTNQNDIIYYEIISNGFFKYTDSLIIPLLESKKEIKKDLVLTPIKEGAKLTLNHVLFYQGTAKIIEKSYPILDEIYEIMINNPTLLAELHGHTERLGDEKLNMGLSEKRALEIKNYLVNKGIEEWRLKAKGFGSAYPVSKTNPDLNRRVEFIIIRK